MPPDGVETLPEGSTVGRFEIVREIGRGGFGAVYEAFDPELDRRVALKILHGRARGEAAREARLKAEAKTVAGLEHENVVKVFDTNVAADPPYMIMELLRGETLEARLRRGALPIDEALGVAIGVARALAYAHERGVVHRDLKPSNVFLGEDGRIRVLDFGLALVIGRDAPERGGTPSYMAPEQWLGQGEDARTDVFAAAAVLFESLHGRVPYRIVAGRSEALDAKASPSIAAELPRPVDRLLRRALSPDPAERPGAGTAWLAALLEARRDVARRRRRSVAARWLLLGGLPLVAAGGTAASFLEKGWREEREREARFYYEQARASFVDDSPAQVRSEAVTLAAQRAADLGPRERSLLHAWEERVRGNDDAALGIYDGLLRSAPGDRESAYLAGDLLFHQGRFAAAIPRLEVAADVEEPGAWALDHLAVALHELGRTDDLLRLGRRLAARPPSAAILHALSIAWGSIGEGSASLAAARRALQLGGGATALEDMAASLYQSGDLPGAEALLRERLSLEGPGSLEAREALAVVLGAQGRRREGLALWDATAAGWSGDHAWLQVLRAAFRAGDGRADAVWRDFADAGSPDWAAFDVCLLVARLGDADHLSPCSQRLGDLERRASLAVLRGRGARSGDAAARALDALEAIVATPGWAHGDLAFFRAELALAAGRPRDTVDLLARDRTRYRRLPIGMLQSWMLPRGLYLQALAHQRLGERREARAAIGRLLASWRRADEGQALLSAARLLRARLEREP